jgi:hypothetical protein
MGRQNAARRVGRRTVLFLTGAFIVLIFAQAATVTITGSWSLTIGSGNLQGGAGSNLTSTYTSTSGAISMALSATYRWSTWSVSVNRVDTSWNANFVLQIERTGNGSGSGTIAGGTTYLTITTTSQTFVTGTGVLTGITLQEHSGSGMPHRAASITGRSPRPPKCLSVHCGEMRTDSTPAIAKPNSR